MLLVCGLRRFRHAHAPATRSRSSASSKLERASVYFEKAKSLVRASKRNEAGFFYAKAQKILLSVLRKNGIKAKSIKPEVLDDEVQGIRDEYITQLMERAWQSMNA
jgi:hypothetical protein